jgi:hypothetical protein
MRLFKMGKVKIMRLRNRILEIRIKIKVNLKG